MFTKGNILYSEPYKYLKVKDRSIFGLMFNLDSYSEEDFEEIDIDRPLQIEISKGRVYWQNNLFFIKPTLWTYAGVKTSIIKSRYSDDDQMALILNKDNSEEDTMLYTKMQEWREFASEVAKGATELL